MNNQEASSKAEQDHRLGGTRLESHEPSEGGPDRSDQDKAFQDKDMVMDEESERLLDVNRRESGPDRQQRRTFDTRPAASTFQGRLEGGDEDASVNSLDDSKTFGGSRVRNSHPSAKNNVGSNGLRKSMDLKDGAKLDIDSQFGFSLVNDEDPQLQLLQGDEQDLPTQESELDYFESFLQYDRREFVIFGSKETAKTFS